VREIRVFLVGLGNIGSMLLRSLTWFGQMDGYALTIDAFDVDEAAESCIQAACPELVDSIHNNRQLVDDAQYRIRFHSGVDASGKEFTDLIQTLAIPTFVFVSLGDDDANIRTASNIKIQLLRKSRVDGEANGDMPKAIHVVVQDPRRARALNNEPILNSVGDFEGICSYETVLDQELEKKAESVHTRWYKNDPSSLKKAKEEYWQREYYRNSSMAEVIHEDIRNAILFSSKEDCLSDEALAILEHRRWLAYMRSEGYVFSGSTDEKSRCDEAKLHNLLVSDSDLPESEKKLTFDREKAGFSEE
jgi:hypothetical protein